MSRKNKRTQRRGKPREESKRYLVLCEGESEEMYAFALKRSLGRAAQRGLNVEIVKKGDPEALLKEARRRVNEARKEGIPFDGVWLFFDHDNRENIGQVFSEIAKKKWQFAFSNICFEVWLLLHFVDAPPRCAKPKEAVDHLEKYWKKEFGKSGYSKNCNHLDLLRDERRKEAAARAEKLRKKHMVNQPDVSPWQCNPWTNVDELVAWFESLDKGEM